MQKEGRPRLTKTTWKDDLVLLNGKSQQLSYIRMSVLARSSILKDECIFYMSAADEE